MKTALSRMACAALVGLGVAGTAQAVTIDFDSTPVGTYTTLTYGAATVTYPDGNGKFDVAAAAPGSPISGNALISYFQNPDSTNAFRVDFAGGATAVSIGAGDFNADEDEPHLEAYDSFNTLVASSFLYIPAPTFGGGTLSLTSLVPIDHVKFYETGSFPGAIYWDNLSYTAAVPEPQTYAMLLLGIGLTGFMARRRQLQGIN